MNVQQALEIGQLLTLPGFLVDDESLSEQRRLNEEAIATLIEAYFEDPQEEAPFDFDLVLKLADHNRELCDLFGIERLQATQSPNLPHHLSDEDLVRGVAKLQRRSVRSVKKTAGFELQDLGIAYIEKAVSGPVVGVDIETTSRWPERGYIINIGLVPAILGAQAAYSSAFSDYFGVPNIYQEKIPLSEIHNISWTDLEKKTPFRQATELHKFLLKAFKKYPLMAHNAAFEDRWFLLNIEGYAEAKRAGKISIVDTRDICRRIDPDTRSLPHDSSPAALENWAHRRGTLALDDRERHLGTDDVYLMLDTVCAEFRERNMFTDA